MFRWFGLKKLQHYSWLYPLKTLASGWKPDTQIRTYKWRKKPAWANLNSYSDTWVMRLIILLIQHPGHRLTEACWLNMRVYGVRPVVLVKFSWFQRRTPLNKRCCSYRLDISFNVLCKSVKTIIMTWNLLVNLLWCNIWQYDPLTDNLFLSSLWSVGVYLIVF